MSSDVNVQNMMWRPPLIRLTAAIPAPGDGGSRAVYIHPDQISAVHRGQIVSKNPDGSEQTATCTMVVASCFSHHIGVTESPDEVARLRDRAFGVTQKLESV